MSNVQKNLEGSMDEYLVKNAPFQIPKNARKTIADVAPILALIGGILSFLAAYSLWHAGHVVDGYVDLANNIARTYGGSTYNPVNHLGAMYYVSLAVIIAQGALMLFAYPGLKARSKSRGWDLLLLGSVANFIYNVLVAFTDYGNVGSIIGSAIGLLVSLYILAQIRDQYGSKQTVKATPASPVKKSKK